MDVYGYNAYNQPDELANQMYAQQALSSPPFNRSMGEGHMMPVPSGSPWNPQGLPWGSTSPPEIVQFTGQQSAMEVQKFTPVVHSKRKSLDTMPVIPAKQLITEERMAAHLNGLHISSEYTSHTLATEELLMDVIDDLASSSTSFTKAKGPKLILSEELKKLKTEPLLPPSIMERLEKPCMSLMVWKPKENDIEEKLKEAIEKENQSKEMTEDEEPVRRNGVLVTELGSMDVEM